MPVITEGLNLGDLLKYEAPNLYSRDQVTVAAGQNLVLGTVVGIAMLIYRRRTTGPVFMATTANDTVKSDCATHNAAVRHMKNTFRKPPG